jgi:hypothetical protein
MRSYLQMFGRAMRALHVVADPKITIGEGWDVAALRDRIIRDKLEIRSGQAVAVEINGRVTRLCVRVESGTIRRVFPVRHGSFNDARIHARRLAADLGLFFIIRRNPK